MNIMDYLPSVIGLILSIGIIKLYAGKAIAIAKETSELLNVVVSALSDNKVSTEEIAQIKKEGKDVAAAFKAILSK